MDAFVQGMGLPDVILVKLDPGHTVADLKRKLTDAAGISITDLNVFPEDGDEPFGDEHCFDDGDPCVHLHVHRCRRVAVTVRYNGQRVERSFPPSATAKRVRRWAVIKAFDLPRDQVGEHLLLVAGTGERVDLDTHVGRFAICPACDAAFDLVPTVRING